MREVRGLRRCSSTVCARKAFKNRDSIGALNILRCFVDTERPATLTRNLKRGKVKLSSFVLRTLGLNKVKDTKGNVLNLRAAAYVELCFK